MEVRVIGVNSRLPEDFSPFHEDSDVFGHRCEINNTVFTEIKAEIRASIVFNYTQYPGQTWRSEFLDHRYQTIVLVL